MLILKPTVRETRKYGYIPDLPDQRDRYSVAHEEVRVTPKRVDLATHAMVRHAPFPFNQGDFSSCTGEAFSGATYCALVINGLGPFTPSRFAIYYGEREIESTIAQDIGAMPRDALKVLSKTGVAMEALWPHDATHFAGLNPFEHDIYYREAARHKVTRYERVPQDRDAIMRTLAAGFPICFGVSVYESFDTDRTAATGKIPLPKTSEGLLGGHMLMLTGGAIKTASGPNSWGRLWGRHGFFTMPWDYILNPDLAADFWVIKMIANLPAGVQ